MLADLMNRLAALESRLNQVLRVCTVVSVQDAAATVRVKLPDSGNMVSQPLPVLTRKSQDDKDYDLPDVGEQVVCVFLPIGLEQGFVLGSHYQQVDKPPVSDRNKWHRMFKDGTFIEYDRANHALTGSIQGTIDIEATGTAKLSSETEIQLQAPTIRLKGHLIATGPDGSAGTNSITGNLAVEGNIDASGTVTDAGGNTNHHDHGL